MENLEMVPKHKAVKKKKKKQQTAFSEHRAQLYELMTTEYYYYNAHSGNLNTQKMCSKILFKRSHELQVYLE